MAIEFNCPHCGVPYKLKEELAGKTGKCRNPKCLKPILIPYRSTGSFNGPTLPAKPIDAEALAAAAFAEEAPPLPPKEQAAAKKIPATCLNCDHKFQVDEAMAGKNTQCPECRKVFRVQKPVEDKPLDWRNAASNKPSMAKVTEPVPSGVWDATAKVVSGEALKKAGALEVEEEEEPGERRIRRIKKTFYRLAILGAIAFAVVTIWTWRKDSKQEKWMVNALNDLSDKDQGTKKPELRAAIHCLAGTYFVREAKDGALLKTATDHFDKSRGELQDPKLKPDDDNRNAMLAELAASIVACGGDAKEVELERRLPWKEVQSMIRKCVDKIPATEKMEMRSHALRLLVRKLVEKDQGALAMAVAQTCCAGAPAELPEMYGRVGIELFLAKKKDLAAEVLAKMPKELPAMPAGMPKAAIPAKPAATALWLALNATGAPRDAFNWMARAPVKDQTKNPSRESVLAFSEGLALQGNFEGALDAANTTTNPIDKIEALMRIATVALDTGRNPEAEKCLEQIAEVVKTTPKEITLNSWHLARAAELAMRANKADALAIIVDGIKDDTVRSWAKLAALRVKLAGLPKTKADETWAETAPKPEQANLAQALAQAAIARHNAAAGERFSSKTVELLPSATIRPFVNAGIALGTEDRRRGK